VGLFKLKLIYGEIFMTTKKLRKEKPSKLNGGGFGLVFSEAILPNGPLLGISPLLLTERLITAIATHDESLGVMVEITPPKPGSGIPELPIHRQVRELVHELDEPCMAPMQSFPPGGILDADIITLDDFEWVPREIARAGGWMGWEENGDQSNRILSVWANDQSGEILTGSRFFLLNIDCDYEYCIPGMIEAGEDDLPKNANLRGLLTAYEQACYGIEATEAEEDHRYEKILSKIKGAKKKAS
jgi:hypothetical protein